MVLINGVKYACERCIRGHRVTTCTHTDQPLMMIKPKGRPSTLCDHCKHARKSKNQHQKCTCQNRIPGQPHDSGCACKDDDSCQCQKTSSSSSASHNNNSILLLSHHKKKSSLSNYTPLKKLNSASSSSSSSLPGAISVVSKKKIINQDTTPNSPIITTPIDSSDFNLIQRSNIHNLESDNNNNNNNNNDNDNGLIKSNNDVLTNNNSNSQSNINMNFQFFDMNLSTGGGSMSSEMSSIIPPPLDQNSTNLMNNNNNNKNSNSFASNLNLLSQGRIGMDYLNDFKPTTSPTNSSRIGEVSVPLDEYVQPLQQMTSNLDKLITDKVDSNQQEQEQEQNSTKLEQQPQLDFFTDIPVPFGGTGLLDLFQENHNLDSNNNNNINNESSTSISSMRFQNNPRSPTNSELSPSNTDYIGSRFPPSSTSNSSLTNFTTTTLTPSSSTASATTTNDSSSSMFPLFQNVVASTASPLSPTSSEKLHHHSYHQLPPHHSSSSSITIHPHGHHYQTHFSPYPVTNSTPPSATSMPLSKRNNNNNNNNNGENFIFSSGGNVMNGLNGLIMTHSGGSQNGSVTSSSTPTDVFNQLRRPLSTVDSSDSLISLQQQQTLTNDEMVFGNRMTPSPSIGHLSSNGHHHHHHSHHSHNSHHVNHGTGLVVDHQLGSTTNGIISPGFGGQQQQQSQLDNLDLFDGNSIDSYLNKTDFNVL